MKHLFLASLAFIFGFNHAFSQHQTEKDSLHFPQLIYKVNPISFFESPQHFMLGFEKPLAHKTTFAQDIGIGYGDLDYYNRLLHLKGISEIRRYFWRTFQPKKQVFRNKYVAFDVTYRLVQFEMDELIGRNCISWDCNYFERMIFTVRNYNLCAHLKYGKQIQTPIKGIFLDYFAGIGYEWVIGQSPLGVNDSFQDSVQPIYFKLTNDQEIRFSVTAGIRIGYGKPKK